MIHQDFVVIGGTLAGLSAAIQAKESGLENVLLLEAGEAVVQPEIVGQHALSVEYQAPVQRISVLDDGGLLIEAPRLVVKARVALVAESPRVESQLPSFDLPPSLFERFHTGSLPVNVGDKDVLVVGKGEWAADTTLLLVGAGAGVVLCLGGTDPANLSRLARRQLLRVEAERRATILWNSQPDGVADVGGYPMVYFADRRTPDLQFDHVVFRLDASGGSSVGIEIGGVPNRSVYWLIGDPIPEEVVAVSPGEAWETIRSDHYPQLPFLSGRPQTWRPGDEGPIELLRDEHYNATITTFERAHSDLWLLRIKPDRGDTSHLAGQYASLGLGYWESRTDGARDRNLGKLWNRLIRRSYSISSPILDEAGYLVDESRSDELEFYIVLVPPSEERIPALTPRLALKAPGDRIYLGPKVAGRYTLAPVRRPETTVLFLATGTGEAPHNSMTRELLRKGHNGPIVSVVSVRYQDDLAYHDVHRTLEKRFQNYRYLPLVTREPGTPKRYVQDVIVDGTLAGLLGGVLDPTDAHVYACGNPAMIGLPTIDGDGLVTYPEAVGACQLLLEMGFTLDHRGVAGNIHYEEYW